ncbi:very short patch repair endonuclease [Bacteroidota bacterium]
MTDILTKERRSWNMGRIKSKNTKPELIVRSFLHKNGLRFRLHDKNLPGKPDIVLKKFKSVIFVHGCFWHNHKNCKRANIPKSNKRYWIDKIGANVLRDKKNIKELRRLKWNVLIIWECQINIIKFLERLVKKIKDQD